MGVEGGIPQPDLPPGPDPAAPRTPPGSRAPRRAPGLASVASRATGLNQPHGAQHRRLRRTRLQPDLGRSAGPATAWGGTRPRLEGDPRPFPGRLPQSRGGGTRLGSPSRAPGGNRPPTAGWAAAANAVAAAGREGRDRSPLLPPLGNSFHTRGSQHIPLAQGHHRQSPVDYPARSGSPSVSGLPSMPSWDSDHSVPLYNGKSDRRNASSAAHQDMFLA